MNAPTIRPATLADIDLLIALDRSSPTAAHWTEPQYRQLFEGNDASERLVIVAEDSSSQGSGQNKVTAFLVARGVASEWELENIVVASGHRRRGLGKQLLQFLFALARHARGEAIFLEVRESNAAARAFYEKLGFEQMGRRKGYYADGLEDAIIYRRMLK